MAKKKRKDKMDGELITSTVLFIISIIILGIDIGSLVIGMRKGMHEISVIQGIGFALLIPAIIMFFASIYFNFSYRELEEHPGVWSTIMLILTIIPAGLFFLGYKIFTADYSSWPTTKTVQTKDKDGKEHKLTQTTIGSSTYKDENGDYWKTKDDGKTFRRD